MKQELTFRARDAAGVFECKAILSRCGTKWRMFARDFGEQWCREGVIAYVKGDTIKSVRRRFMSEVTA